MAADSAANDRHAALLTLHFSFAGGHKSRALPLTRHDAATIAAGAVAELAAWIAAAPRGWAITGLSLSASNFHGAAAKCASIKDMFARKQAPRVDAAAQHVGAAAAPCTTGAALAESVPSEGADPPRCDAGCVDAPSAEPRGAAASRAAAAEEPSTALHVAARPDAAQHAQPGARREGHAAAFQPPQQAQRYAQADAHAPQSLIGAGGTARLEEATVESLAMSSGATAGEHERRTADDAERACPAKVDNLADPATREALHDDQVAGAAAARVEQGTSDPHQAAPFGDEVAPQATDRHSAASGPCGARPQQAWQDVEVGPVDATVLAALPEELRSEVYLLSRRPAQTAPAPPGRAAKRAKRSQPGLASFLQGRRADG